MLLLWTTDREGDLSVVREPEVGMAFLLMVLPLFTFVAWVDRFDGYDPFERIPTSDLDDAVRSLT